MYYILLMLAVAAVVLLFFGLRNAVTTYLTFRGERLIVCPETHHPAAVRVAAGKAALEASIGKDHIRLSDCSRWPEKKGCGQECLAQIQDSPKSCMVWTIISDWYAGKSCAYCHKPFGQIHWHDHPPALVDSELRTVQWNEVSPETLPDVLSTHWPVCWNCHIAESFRREHPELVVDRPSTPLRISVLN